MDGLVRNSRARDVGGFASGRGASSSAVGVGGFF
jgi:hypothetical protein